MTSASPESSDGRVGVRAALSKAALRLQSDRRLVAMTRDGSGLAFGVIMERYRAPLLAYCRRLLGPDEAEDAFQQTLVNALGALRRDDRDIDLRPWLYRIAHNVAINALTRSGRHYEELDNQYDGVPQPPDILDEKLRVERLVKEICDLPERQRVAVVAHELEGRSYEEIARRMDATTPVVRQLIYRARSRLRDACGVLVPAGALRWLVFADLRTAGSERAGEAVAGGAAGAGLLKAGTALLASGAIATGAGGLLTRTDHRRAVRDQQGSARSQQGSDAASTDRQVAAAPVRPAAPENHLKTLRASRTAARAEGDGSGEERRGSRHSTGDEGDDGPGGERPAGRDDAKARHGGDDHESEPEQTREASNERPDEHSAEDSHGDVRSGSPSGSEGSDSSAGSGPGTPDSASDAPAEE